jgi:hypothetical protein
LLLNFILFTARFYSFNCSLYVDYAL